MLMHVHFSQKITYLKLKTRYGVNISVKKSWNKLLLTVIPLLLVHSENGNAKPNAILNHLVHVWHNVIEMYCNEMNIQSLFY